MLNPDASSVRRSFEHAAIRISEEVNHITGSYKKINLLGFSLGNVALSMTAETLDDVAGVTMVVPGSELATPFWTGIRTRRLSDEYRDTGHTLEAIREEWVKLAPIAHLEVLRGSKTSVVLARHDEYIPYESGQLLVDSMQQAGINPYVTTMNCGHVSAITRFAVGKIG